MNTEQKAGAEGGRVEGKAGWRRGRDRESRGRGRSSEAGGLGDDRLGGRGRRSVKVRGRGGHGNRGRKVRDREAEERPQLRCHSWKRNAKLKER